MNTATHHTQGLLVHDTSGYPKPDVRSASGRGVAITWGVCATRSPKTKEQYDRRTEIDRANARRIVACWNACYGVSTEDLEARVMSNYIHRLALMDWQYQFSDDARVVREGEAQLADLYELQAVLDPDGAIWLERAPKGKHVPQPRIKP